jgi:hypothetical protein
MRIWTVGAAFVLALTAPAAAQVASRAPEWARPLLVTDNDAVNVRQSALPAPESGIAARLSIAPVQGGVARLVRFEVRPEGATLTVRRFTGHVRNGWVLWGGEQAVAVPLDPARRVQLERLTRTALAAGALGGESSASAPVLCASGDLAWLEVSDPGRAVTFERRCAFDGAAGALARALSEAAGSRDEEELYQSGIAEVLAADRALAEAARLDLAAAIAGATMDEAARARVVIATPAFANLNWAPDGAEVSARGDFAYTWGRWSSADASGPQAEGAYVAVWRRDPDGAWKLVARNGG